MRQLTTNRRRAPTILATLLLMSSPLCASEISSANGELKNTAKNLARINCGTHVYQTTPDGHLAETPGATALILEDNTLSCELAKGENTFVLALSSIQTLDRLSFVNQEAAAQGTVQIALSNHRLNPNDPHWVNSGVPQSFSGQRFFRVSLAGLERKYLKLAFRVQRAGRLAALGLYGNSSLQTYAAHQVGRSPMVHDFIEADSNYGLEDRLGFNFANSYAQARVVYVSSGSIEGAQRMIDDDVQTGFAFDAGDRHPTVIIELARTKRLRRVSALYDMAQSDLQVYLLGELPADPDDLGNAIHAPAASTNSSEKDEAAVEFAAEGARYVALRWTPKGISSTPLEVTEIGAFGVVPASLFASVTVPDAPSIAMAGEGGVADSTSSLGPSDPPTLAVSSP
jgi:hypothetical protein